MKISLFTIFFFLISSFFIACDFNSGNNDISPTDSFEITFYDENLNVITTLQHDSSSPLSYEKSKALYGNDFIPDHIKENLDNNNTWNSDYFYQNEIHLRIYETDENEESEFRFATFRIFLPNDNDFSTGRFDLVSQTEGSLENSLRRIWENRNQSSITCNKNSILHSNDPELEWNDGFAHFIISQHGFIPELSSVNQQVSEHFPRTTESGYVEITNANGKSIEGIIQADLLISSISFEEILELDEFPEEIEYHRISVEGRFTAIRGNWQDLQ